MLGLAILLANCVVAGTVRISQPAFELASDVVKLDADGVIHAEGIELSLVPNTSRVGFLFAGPFIPIIPLGRGGTPNDENMPFRLMIKFVTDEDGLSLIPRGVTLQYGGKEYRPVSFWGPLHKTYDARVFDRTDPGHKWGCSATMASVKKTDVGKTERIVGTGCFLLEFPIVHVGVEDSFAIAIEGLEKNGNRINLPKVLFHPVTKFDTGATMVEM